MTEPSAIARAQGRSLFGSDPAAYERGRPGYPAELYARLRERCGLGRYSRIFEVGAGTGIATRRLLDSQPAALWVVEPDPRLAAHLRTALAGAPLRIIEAPFEEAELPGRAFDLGVAAMSFHWLEQRSSLERAHGALVPGGWWSMWWTVYGRQSAEDAFTLATEPLFASLPKGPSNAERGGRPFALDEDARLGDLAAAGFESALADAWAWQESFSTSRLVDLYTTFSAVQALPESQRRAFLTRLAAIADEQFGGRVERPLRTVLYTARRPA